MLVRAATVADLAWMIGLGSASLWTPRWSDPAWRALLLVEAEQPIVLVCVLLGDEGEKRCGYVVASIVVDVAEIENLAVTPEFRRCGVARRLVEAVREEAAVRGVVALQLEVNERNESARAFYGAMGFVEDGRREGYYGSGQAAVLLSANLKTRGG